MRISNIRIGTRLGLAFASMVALIGIAATAGVPEQVAAARTAGFDDYWTQPLHLPTMLAQLQRQIELSRGD